MLTIRNNTAAELIISGQQVDGSTIVILPNASIDVPTASLVVDAEENMIAIYGSKISISHQGGFGAVVDLADTAVTLSASDLISGVIYTAAPSTARAQTTPTAAQIVAAVDGWQAGSRFEFTIVVTAAFNETLTAGSGVTIVGNAVVNNASGTFIGIINSGTAVTIYRK